VIETPPRTPFDPIRRGIEIAGQGIELADILLVTEQKRPKAQPIGLLAEAADMVRLHGEPHEMRRIADGSARG
jgi:hypothetical protein